MRVLLLIPDGYIHRIRIGPFVRSMREAPLSMTTLAALSPPELEIDFKYIDENVSHVPLDHDMDLVAISALTGTANRAYELADHYRRRGIPVVLGGVHVTILPEEAAQHADAIVVGGAETAWRELLRDFTAGQMKERYGQNKRLPSVLTGVPGPRRDLQCSISYMMPSVVMATRGCPHVCDFCAVPAAWPGYSRRPIGDVIRDIKISPGRLLAINDVSLTDDADYAKELFREMIPLKKQWGGLATVQVAKDPEMLELLQKSGCRYLLLGFESLSAPALSEIRKGFNKPEEYKQLVKSLHDHGISVQGTFIFGFDHDDKSVFDDTVDWVNDLKIDIPRYSILTPYPGTPLFSRLKSERRILSFDWADYDTMHVVMKPAKMTPEELYSGFKRAYRNTFKLGQAARRMRRLDLNGAVNFVGNLAYRRFSRKLDRDTRYALPCNPDAATEVTPCLT